MSASSFVKEQIESNKVVIFSKTYCSFSQKGKQALFMVVPKDQVVVIELDLRDDGDAIQEALLAISGRRSVPQVFIGGRFVGGGDETAAAQKNGTLQQKIEEAGLVMAH